MAINTMTAAADISVSAGLEEKTVQPLDMDVMVRLTEPKGKLLGFANVTFNEAVTVTDFKVLRGDDGALYVGMPSKPDSGSRTGYANTARIPGDETKLQLTGAVVTEYHAAVEKLKARAAAITAQEQGDKPPRMADQIDKAAKKAEEHNAAIPATEKADKVKNAER